jgi:hypothetical protein
LSKKPKTYRAEAVVELPTPVLLGSALLGLLRPAVIGGVPVHVVLPDFDRSGNETILHRRSRVNWVESLKTKPGEDDSEHPFGVAHGWGEEREFIVKRLLILSREKLTQRQASELAHAAEPWAELVHTWIEVVARTDLHEELVSHDERGGATFVWLDKGKPPGKVLKGRHELILSLGSAPEITPAQWGGALARASDGARPPEQANRRSDLRIEYLLGAYRTLTDTAHRDLDPNAEHVRAFERSLADIQLLGSPDQAAMAARIGHQLATESRADFDDLLLSLRDDLREELDLESLPKPPVHVRVTS